MKWKGYSIVLTSEVSNVRNSKYSIDRRPETDKVCEYVHGFRTLKEARGYIDGWDTVQS